MIRPLILSLSLSLSPMLLPAHAADERGLREASTVCEAYLQPMRDVMATMKSGTTLTEGQEALWRVWNKRCAHASWQKALAEGLPPVPEQPDFGYRIPPPALTWRDYVGAVLIGLERGLTAPITSCRTTYAQKGNRAGYYTTCSTY